MAREQNFARTYAKVLNAYPHVMAAQAAIHAAIRASSACLPETAACAAVTAGDRCLVCEGLALQSKLGPGAVDCRGAAFG